MHGVQDPKEEWSRAVLFKFIEAQETFNPMLFGLVWIILLPSPGGSFLCTNKTIQRRRKKGRPGDGGTTQQAIPDSKIRIPIDGSPL